MNGRTRVPVTRRGGLPRLAALALLVVLAACQVAPVTTPEPSGSIGVASPSPSASALPSASPLAPTAEPSTAVSGPYSHWESVGPSLELAEPRAVVWGTPGWVLVGACLPPTCEPKAAAAWFSSDGSSWTRIDVPGGEGAELTTVAWDGSGYVAAGNRTKFDPEVGPRVRALTWRSSDGRTWKEGASIDFGRCGENCPAIGPIAASSEVAVLGLNVTSSGDRSVVYSSASAGAWRPVPPTVFRLSKSEYVVDIVAVADRFVLAERNPYCEAKPGRLWTSRDGMHWQAVAQTTPGSYNLNLASDSRRVVLAEQWCSDGGGGTNASLSLDEGATWSSVRDGFPSYHVEAAFVGGSLVVVGLRSTQAESPSDELWVFTSPDGAAWNDVRTDLTFDTHEGECALRGLAGGPDGALLIGSADCPGIWFSRA